MTIIINNATGLCLDGRFNHNVYTNVCIGRSTQNWTLIEDNWQVASTNECLSFFGNSVFLNDNVLTSPCNQTNVYQHWTLVKSTHLQVEYNGLCLEGNEIGDRALLSKCNYENPSQVWTIDDTDARHCIPGEGAETEPDL